MPAISRHKCFSKYFKQEQKAMRSFIFKIQFM